MRKDGLNSITDSELNEVVALVGRGRSIPAVIVAAIIRRLEAAESDSAPSATGVSPAGLFDAVYGPFDTIEGMGSALAA